MTRTRPLRETVAANIQAVMNERGMNQSEVSRQAKAKQLKLDQKTVSRATKGVKPPTLDTIEAIAIALKVEAWQLLLPELDPTQLPVVSHGTPTLSSEDRTEVEEIALKIEDLKPAQRRWFASNENVRNIVFGEVFPAKDMRGVWTAPTSVQQPQAPYSSKKK